MRISFAHLRTQGIDFAVFNANASDGTNASRAKLLAQLTLAAKNSGLNVNKSALAYSQGGRIRFYGTQDLVRYLSKNFRPQWTHSIDV